MNLHSFENWLNTYKRAWENFDTAASIALFTDDAAYQLSLFSEPLRGREALTAYWSNVAASQSAVRFDYHILAVSDELGVNQWSASFMKRKTGKLIHLDGIFVVKLNDEGRCFEFREWWEGTK
jgi:hypothetical protein